MPLLLAGFIRQSLQTILRIILDITHTSIGCGESQYILPDILFRYMTSVVSE